MNPSSPIVSGAAASPLPWWRVGAMWLIVGGLASVVVASFALLAVALRTPDASELPPIGAAAGHRADAPALQARNHAATPRP